MTTKKTTTKKLTAKYVDGFVLVIPKKNIAAYKKMAREAKEVWMGFGALDYKECMGDELTTKASHGMAAPVSFTALSGAKSGDTVWFSFITYKDKTHKKQVNKKVMQFFEKKYANTDMAMPFDMSKMAVGGFRVEVG